MPTANYYLLSQLLTPLNMLSRADENAIASLDLTEEADFKAIVAEHIGPVFIRWSELDRHRVRDALRYFLSTRRAPFGAIFAGQQESPIGVPVNPQLSFRWIWEVLFPGQPFEISASEEWLERINFNAHASCRHPDQYP